MESEPGGGWADAVDKILRMGKVNPESNKILSKAKRDGDRNEDNDSGSEADMSETASTVNLKSDVNYLTKRRKLDPTADALLENELKTFATRGVVHLFNAVKTVNPKSDKKKKKKKKKKKGRRKGFVRG